jgi:acyl-CoA dehydrogenase
VRRGWLVASLMSHSIGAPPVAALGSAEIKRRVLPRGARGARSPRWPSPSPGGSDVAALRTTAVRDGDHYVVNGEKTFITSGMRADYLTVAVRTDRRRAAPAACRCCSSRATRRD